MSNKNSSILIGRKAEIELLEDICQAKSGKIIALYGRMQIGKSYLIKHFIKDKFALHFEGLEKGNGSVAKLPFL